MKQNHVPTHTAALIKAVEIAGSQPALAAKIREYGETNNLPHLRKVSQQTISFWIKKCVFLDAKYWAALEFATDGAVTRHDLRPDVFLRDHAA